MLRLCSFLQRGSDIIRRVFAHKGSRYIDYGLTQLNNLLILPVSSPKIVDPLLMLILGGGSNVETSIVDISQTCETLHAYL